MSNILIADANGRRRVQTEAIAQTSGNHTYSVGTLAEALRYAEIYIPEVLILPDSLPDGNIESVVGAFRSSQSALIRELPIVTGANAQSSGDHVFRARNNTAAALVVEAENALSNLGTAT